jgi:hypothetical protein
MYILLGCSTEKEFCKTCKITKKELDEFLFTEYPFPVSWLHVLYTYATTPKEFAFISFFIGKIYGVTPEKNVKKVPKSYNRQFITGATNIQSVDKIVKGNRKQTVKPFLPQQSKPLAKKPPRKAKKEKTSPSQKVKSPQLKSPVNQNITFPTQDQISKVLEKAFVHALGDKSCSISLLQDFFSTSLPKNVTVQITPTKITFHDITGKERDRFNVPKYMPLE